jgi:hypothetical protein
MSEEGIQSHLKTFFDDTGDQNLDIAGIFALGAGAQ